MKEDFLDLSFPLGGIDVSQRFGKQPTRQVAGGGYARTTPSATNVRAYEPSTSRARGGSRAGLSRYINAKVNGTGLIQDLCVIVGTGYTAPGGGTQTSDSDRIVSLLAVSGGEVKVADAGATAWASTTNGTGFTIPLNTTGLVRSTVLGQKVYFADGTHRVLYDPSVNQLQTWNASSGTFPSNNAVTAYPRLLTTWRGRLVMAGLEESPLNWFMSATGDPTNWNYSPDVVVATQAVAGNNSPLGLIGDVVTALIPFSDDILFVGGDSSLWAISGDPMAGGQIDRVSDGIGVAWGNAWCKDPEGTIYFFSNRGGVFAVQPGQQPVRITQPIDSLMRGVNTGTHTIRLLWDDRMQGMHVFITKTSASAATTHFYWEQRSGAWWQDDMPNDMNPLACCVFDGNLPDDRVALIGSFDGYVRAVDMDATDDDGTDIESSVLLGPVNADTFDEMLVRELQAILGEESGDVEFAVYVGATAEMALSSDPVETGTFTAGRNPTTAVRRAGHSLFLKLSSESRWSFEQCKVMVSVRSKVRRRAKA